MFWLKRKSLSTMLIAITVIAAISQIQFLSGGSDGNALVNPGLRARAAGGVIYKEYYRLMTGSGDWRVTDPNAENPGAWEWLPNPKLPLQISDPYLALSAEAIIDCWGGHVGTTDKKFRLNGNSWIEIPELTTMSNPECYMKQWNPVVPVPISHLKVGTNILEGTSGGQICYNFNWGQWGWYAFILRVYYADSKPHPNGQIVWPTSGATIGENPVIKVEASSPVGIQRVEVLAYYEDYDSDGNGIYKQYQGSYRREMVGGVYKLVFSNHVGTDSTAPYEIKWDTTWVPDQAPGSIKLKARILDNNGVWYETEEVTGITLKRSDSVKLYKPYAVPQRFSVRLGQTKYSKVNIPTLTEAKEAKLLVATWNGITSGDPHYTKVNNWITPDYGENHDYSYDEISVPISALMTGENKIVFWSSTEHHELEVLWPGPGIKVRYTREQFRYHFRISPLSNIVHMNVDASGWINGYMTGGPNDWNPVLGKVVGDRAYIAIDMHPDETPGPYEMMFLVGTVSTLKAKMIGTYDGMSYDGPIDISIVPLAGPELQSGPDDTEGSGSEVFQDTWYKLRINPYTDIVHLNFNSDAWLNGYDEPNHPVLGFYEGDRWYFAIDGLDTPYTLAFNTGSLSTLQGEMILTQDGMAYDGPHDIWLTEITSPVEPVENDSALKNNYDRTALTPHARFNLL